MILSPFAIRHSPFALKQCPARASDPVKHRPVQASWSRSGWNTITHVAFAIDAGIDT
jgi:hypothetical protein